MARSLPWLRERCNLLRFLSTELRETLFMIAGEKAPSTTATLAELEISEYDASEKTRTTLVQATRWLAMIRRDHGEEAFRETIELLQVQSVEQDQQQPQQPRAEKSRGQGERTMRSLATVMMIVFVVFWTAACSGPPPLPASVVSSECFRTSDCPAGEYCYAGACRRGCANDADCPTDFGFICDRGTRRCSCLDGPGRCEEPPCTPESEVCNGLDDDCDGQTDEDNVCCTPRDEVCDDGLDNDCDGRVDGADSDCEVADGGTTDEGTTDGGTTDGDSGIVDDIPSCVPEPEVCDGQDNDCDGLFDEGGVCVVPDEVCDSVDNDGDGLIDEGFAGLGNLCATSPEVLGECRRQGVVVCTADGLGVECNARPGAPESEICDDGLDNDCDGRVDGADSDCEVADGGTTDEGTTDGGTTDGGVADGGTVDDIPSCTPEPEVCDGLDNDCDGRVDEGCAELCGDGADNDGDGLIDEGFDDLGSSCYAGRGECRRQGVVVCSEDNLGLVCADTELQDILQPGIPEPEVCDGLDNDCDGEVDEVFDLNTDTANCGICGNVCASGESCLAGECKYVPQECLDLLHAPSFETADGGFNTSQPSFNGWHVEGHSDGGRREVSYSFVTDEDGTPDGRVYLRVENTLPAVEEWNTQLQQLEQFQVGESYGGSVYLRADVPCSVYFQVMDHWDWQVPAFTFQPFDLTADWQQFQLQSFSVEKLASGHPYRVALMLGRCSAVEVDYVHLYRASSCE